MVEDGSRNLTPVPADVDYVSKGRNIVMVIGIDYYVNWPKLHNAVSDAKGILKLFVEKLGFISPIPALLDSDATQKNLTSLVQNQLHNMLQPDDALLIFFAGHGHTRMDQVGDETIDTGYIIPVEAQIDHWNNYIKINSFLEDISKLKARYILVILDACRSGLALGKAMEIYRSAVRYEQDLLNHVSRKVITSARSDQEAIDSGPVEGHSLFTGTLIDGLNWGKADVDGNGLVTSSELGLYLQQRVGQASESKQTPDFGSFYLDKRGEMVISLRDDTFDAFKARAFIALQQGDTAQFKELVEKVVALRPKSPEALYLQYRLFFSQGNIDDAVEMVHQLQTLDLSEGTVPLSKHDLWELGVQLEYWKPVLLIPVGDFPLEVTMLTGPDKEHLAEAPRKPEDGRQEYLIEEGAVGCFRVKNLTQNPAHLYSITITPPGRLLVDPLLRDYEVNGGLMPGMEGRGSPFLVENSPGLNEIRLFYSPERASSMLSPLNPRSRAIERLNDNMIDLLIMKTVWYRVMERRQSQ